MTIGQRLVPVEYAEFQFCRAVGLRETVDEMEEARYRLWVGFLQAESEADRMEQERRKFLSSR